MDTPTHPNLIASKLPFVGRMPGTQLTPIEEQLLQRAFLGRSEIFVEQAFHSGYSGASAYLITSPEQAPIVAKMAHPLDLRREYNAYHEWVAQTAPQNTTRLQGELLTSADGQLGLITYSFAGGDPRMRTHNLSLYYQTHGGKATASVIDRLFRTYGRQWWANHQLKRVVMGEVYDRLLPVHLQLTSLDAADPVTTNILTLQSGNCDPTQISTLVPGQRVLLQGFEVIKVRRGSLTLQGATAAGVRAAPLRVRLDGDFSARYQRGERVAQQLATVTATRAMLLSEAAANALPGIDLQGEEIALGSNRYPNPLYMLHELLDSRQDVETSIIHGDLNLQNVLVDKSTGFAWLIDFGETRRGPVLFDLQRLEVQVLSKLLPARIAQSQLQPRHVCLLLEALHTAMPAELSPIADLQEPYTLLVTLRQLAQQYLVDNREWAEYYRGLILVLLGALKYDELDADARAIAFLSVAALTRLLEQPLFAPAHLNEQPPAPGESPFKGLHYFDVADSELFYGREALTRELLAALQNQHFLAVIGASGSGKSSLVRAGLIPSLSSQPALQRQRWHVQIITPTARPLESLALALTRDQPSVTAAATLLDDLRRDLRSFYLYCRRQFADQHLLLIVDQFEELFTLCQDKNERRRFIDCLLEAITPANAQSNSTGSAVTLVITLRADFYAHCAEFDTLRQALERRQKYIGAMSLDELRRAIEEPAQRNSWRFESGLVDLLLKDVGSEPGGLPLLSHALLETWKRRRGRTLTMSGYAESGRVQGAIAHTADTIYQQHLAPSEKIIAKNIFLRLTELGEGSHDTRRRVGLHELLPTTADQRTVESVLNALVDARLLTVDDSGVEVAHEALIREWPTLREWLAENREGLRLHRHLSAAAQEWANAEWDPDLLYRGARLEQALQWCANNANQLNQLEDDFLDESQLQEASRWQEKEDERRQAIAQAQALAAEQQRLAEEQRRRAEEQSRFVRRLGWLSAALAAVFFLAVGAALYAQRQQALANQSAETANAALDEKERQAEIAKSESRRADQKAQEAESAAAEAQTQATLAQSARAQAEKAANRARAGEMAANVQLELAKPVPDPSLALLLAIRSVTMTQGLNGTQGLNEQLLPAATYALDAAVRVALPWRRTISGHTAGVRALAFSPDGSRFVSGSWDNSAAVWDAATGELLFSLPGHTAGVVAVAYGATADGQPRIATASADKTAILWDAQGNRLFTLRGHSDTVNGVAFSPDGRWIATASADKSVRLWNADGSEAAVFHGHTEAVNSVVFTPNAALNADPNVAPTENSPRLLTASADKTVRLWDVTTQTQLLQFDHPDAVLAAVCSPDCRQIATATEDGTIRLWPLLAGAQSQYITKHFGSALSVAFSPDGGYLLSAGKDKVARLWDLQNEKLLMQLAGHSDTVTAAAFRPNGWQIVTASLDKSIHQWDFPADRGIFTLHNPSDWFFSATYSPDGKTIATANWDKTARLWDAATGVERMRFVGHSSGLLSVVFSPDGNFLLTASDDNTARIWDVASGAELQRLQGHSGRLWSANFSPDGRRVVTGSKDGSARIWDRASGNMLHLLTGHGSTVWSAIFSPNGERVLTVSADGTARLWDAATGTQIFVSATQPAGILSASFNGAGSLLATAGDDGVAQLWDAQTGESRLKLVGHIGSIYSVAFNSSATRLLTAGDDGTVRVWDVASGKELLRLIGHTEAVHSARFSPDGKRIVSASEDLSVRTWASDAETLLALAQSRIQRQPAEFSAEEKQRFGVE